MENTPYNINEDFIKKYNIDYVVCERPLLGMEQ